MKKMRFLGALLAVLVLVAAIPMTASAVDLSDYTDYDVPLTWQMSTDYATVTGSGNWTWAELNALTMGTPVWTNNYITWDGPKNNNDDPDETNYVYLLSATFEKPTWYDAEKDVISITVEGMEPGQIKINDNMYLYVAPSDAVMSDKGGEYFKFWGGTVTAHDQNKKFNGYGGNPIEQDSVDGNVWVLDGFIDKFTLPENADTYTMYIVAEDYNGVGGMSELKLSFYIPDDENIIVVNYYDNDVSGEPTGYTILRGDKVGAVGSDITLEDGTEEGALNWKKKAGYEDGVLQGEPVVAKGVTIVDVLYARTPDNVIEVEYYNNSLDTDRIGSITLTGDAVGEIGSAITLTSEQLNQMRGEGYNAGVLQGAPVVEKGTTIVKVLYTPVVDNYVPYIPVITGGTPVVTEPEVEIPDEEPPLVNIPESEVPLAEIPQTGSRQSTAPIAALLLLCAAGVAALAFGKKQKANN